MQAASRAAPAEEGSPAARILVAALLLTPLAILAALESAGAGDGDYLWAKVFFPYTMISAEVFGSIIPHFIILALYQVPAYGLALAWVARYRPHRLRGTTVGLLLLHAAAAGVCFLLSLEHYS